MVVIGVNTGEQGQPAEKARGFRDQHKLTYPILVDADDKVAGMFGVDAFPTNVIIDREGTVRYIEPGFNQPQIDKLLKELMER